MVTLFCEDSRRLCRVLDFVRFSSVKKIFLLFFGERTMLNLQNYSKHHLTKQQNKIFLDNPSKTLTL